MSRRKNPLLAILSLAIVGAILTAGVRFGYFAHLIIKAGESLTSVPLDDLLFEVMELQRGAIYGAIAGAVLGIVLALIDLFRYGGRSEEYSWTARDDEFKPFVEDEVKARRMKTGDSYLKEHGSKGSKGDAT